MRPPAGRVTFLAGCDLPLIRECRRVLSSRQSHEVAFYVLSSPVLMVYPSDMGEDRTDADQPSEATTSRQRVTVSQASEILGITVEAVRGRIKRGTLDHERHSGTVYVLLHADQMPTGPQPGDDQTTDRLQSDNTALISAKDETIATLREQLEAERNAHAEARRLLLEALTKIPAAIEAPQGATEDAETVEETSEGSEPRSYAPGAQESVQESWWPRERVEPRSDRVKPPQAPQRPQARGLRGLRRRIFGW